MSLARMVCGLLAGQALGASVIRSSARQAVEANGGVQGLRSVDASTAEGILAQVEDMAKHHAKMDKPKIATIQELTTQLETALSDTHQSAEKQVASNLLAIEKCNEDKASTFSEIAATTKKTVEAERKAHATCRDEEMETHVDMVKKCKHLKTWLKSLTSPEKTGNDDAAKVEWVGKMDGYWCPKGEKAKEKSKTCKKAKAAHKAAKEKCDPLQSQFELGFCTWRVELIDACGAHTTCYDDALKTYKDHKADTEQLIVQWKTEYVALKKIACYVNVWLSDDDANTVDADQLTECQDLKPDESKMDIDFKSPADKAECSLAEVAKYPGTDAFKQTEYEKFLDVKETIGDDTLSHFIKDPTPCDGTETTTEAATTVEETTVQTTRPPTTTTTKAVCYAEVYQHSGFKGWKATFAEGNHDYEEFVKTAAQNDHASAIKVFGKGCQAVLYQHARFKGTSATFTTGSYDYSVFHKKFPNDQLSSLKVQHTR